MGSTFLCCVYSERLALSAAMGEQKTKNTNSIGRQTEVSAKKAKKKFFSRREMMVVWCSHLSSRGREMLSRGRYVVNMQKQLRTEEGDESSGCELHLALSGSDWHLAFAQR